MIQKKWVIKTLPGLANLSLGLPFIMLFRSSRSVFIYLTPVVFPRHHQAIYDMEYAKTHSPAIKTLVPNPQIFFLMSWRISKDSMARLALCIKAL